MIYCILDANILYKDPFFRDGDLKKLLILSQLGYVKILLPDVVVQELKNHVLADNENELKKIKESIKRLNKTCLNTFPAYSISDNLSEKFDLRIKELTDTGNVIVIPSTPVTIKEIMDRYGIHKKPFDDNKASFRDAAIWLETIKYVKTVLVPGDFDHSVTGEKSQKVTRENDQKSHLTPLIIQFPEDCQKQFLPFL